jgi:hypothetical protein
MTKVDKLARFYASDITDSDDDDEDVPRHTPCDSFIKPQVDALCATVLQTSPSAHRYIGMLNSTIQQIKTEEENLHLYTQGEFQPTAPKRENARSPLTSPLNVRIRTKGGKIIEVFIPETGQERDKGRIRPSVETSAGLEDWRRIMNVLVLDRERTKTVESYLSLYGLVPTVVSGEFSFKSNLEVAALKLGMVRELDDRVQRRGLMGGRKARASKKKPVKPRKKPSS